MKDRFKKELRIVYPYERDVEGYVGVAYSLPGAVAISSVVEKLTLADVKSAQEEAARVGYFSQAREKGILYTVRFGEHMELQAQRIVNIFGKSRELGWKTVAPISLTEESQEQIQPQAA